MCVYAYVCVHLRVIAYICSCLNADIPVNGLPSTSALLQMDCFTILYFLGEPVLADYPVGPKSD